ncbi:MAG TPA: GNAT family N-acetyltransferase [Tepidisphaeraceae bacterium]|nr:GNAT family N-acetyltransferase [Tepidisphaeraceae bacterium]
MSEPECYPLEWDSQFFSLKIAQVAGPLLTEERCRRIDAQCRAEGIRCVYLRLPASPGDPAETRLAEDHGFHLVDVKTTLHRKIDASFRPRTIASRVRRATEPDLPRLEQIAADSHRNTRFFYDGRFPLERCEELYRTWIRQQVRDADFHVAVAEADGEIAGYSTSRHDRSGFISLMAVDDNFRHRGIGDDLVNASLAWLSERGATSAGVTTQGWNIPAQRLYQRNGFRTSIVDLYFHKWFD